MSDYIKREDAIGYIKHVYHESVKFYEVDEEEVIDSLVEALNALPSADVVEVRHGRWVEVKSWESEKHSVTDMRCNLCGKFASLVLPHKTKCTYNYCPNCGARMDGEGDE